MKSFDEYTHLLVKILLQLNLFLVECWQVVRYENRAPREKRQREWLRKQSYYENCVVKECRILYKTLHMCQHARNTTDGRLSPLL